MSSTNRGADRVPDDFYRTEAEVVLPLLAHLPPRAYFDVVLDPCCGDGAILKHFPSSARGIELNPERAAQARALGYSVDTADALSVEWSSPDLIVTNPPFSHAMAFLVRALGMVRQGGTVAFLLRLAFLESAGRAQFHREHPSDVYVLSNRPSFAASLKCKEKKACRWAHTQVLEAPRPRACPLCGAGVTCTTTDSCAYGWFVFGPGRGGRWALLGDPIAGAA
jgi:hypothetical protein